MELDDAYDPALLTPTWEGWTFAGWKDDKGNPMDKDSVAHDKVFYADWVDDIAPELGFTSTNNVAETQTVTMNMDCKIRKKQRWFSHRVHQLRVIRRLQSLERIIWHARMHPET